MLKLKIINYQTNQIDEKTLPHGEHIVGRHPSCNIVLDNPEVSRVHGRILLSQEGCYYTDLGSTDGSRVNNEAIAINQKYSLHPDDMVRIGESVILVEDFAPEASQSQPAVQPQIRQWTQGELKVHCVQIIEQTPDVKTFRFMAEKPLLFLYKPGQFVTLELDIEGKKVYRSYSISSSPSRPLCLDITVKRVLSSDGVYPPGMVSNWLHDHLLVGSQLKIKGPSGKFTCIDTPVPKMLMLSAGSGITPMMSMTQWLCDTAANTDIIFFYSAPRPQDMVFRSELEALSMQHPNLKLAMTATRPAMGDRWLGYRGRLNESMLRTIAPDLLERSVYVCGSQGFMADIKGLLCDLEFPMAHYYEESFGGKKPAQNSSPQNQSPQNQSPQNQPPQNQPSQNPVPPKNQNPPAAENPPKAPSARLAQPHVVFAQSGKAVDCDGEEVILDVAETAGIDLPSGCRMGACGACKQTATGTVKYIAEPNGLKNAEQQAGMILPCVACPVGKVIIQA
jgi:glycine betaine catabolism B